MSGVKFQGVKCWGLSVGVKCQDTVSGGGGGGGQRPVMSSNVQ